MKKIFLGLLLLFQVTGICFSQHATVVLYEGLSKNVVAIAGQKPEHRRDCNLHAVFDVFRDDSNSCLVVEFIWALLQR